jgi:hypothetical protein
MQEIKKDIEQLEEASHQLSKRTPTGARLALLLLDNLAELFMYKKVRLIFVHDSQFEPSLTPKYPIGKREKILEHFNEKVNFLVSETKDIEQDEGEVIKIASLGDVIEFCHLFFPLRNLIRPHLSIPMTATPLASLLKAEGSKLTSAYANLLRQGYGGQEVSAGR